MPRGNYLAWRRGTSAQWAAANPILAEGEPGLDTTVDQVKVGNGVSRWMTLPFLGSSALSYDDAILKERVGTLEEETDMPSLTLLFENGLV